MNAVQLLATANPVFFYFAIGLLGLVVGSFLNVVIYRLPIMMQRQWRQQCELLLKENSKFEEEPSYNLVVPRSQCPKCGHLITAIENIPVISYLFQRGRCRDCGSRISPRYPLIEILSSSIALITAWKLGPNAQLLPALFLVWALIALTFIDIDQQLLPDSITLPLIWAGLLLNMVNLYTSLPSAVLGAVSGYLFLWIVYQTFKLFTGKEGMGFGDFKLLALFGAWLGWQNLPVIILLSSLLGAFIGILLIVLQGRDRQQPIPFGPYLCLAGWIALLWGDELTLNYFRILSG
ncbi:MAG: A24 family peptidase [Gammaproteobacteria bacterium]|nr:MAG: A24 family peptidase [Gammaproteobacteria bacterium]